VVAEASLGNGEKGKRGPEKGYTTFMKGRDENEG